MTTRHLFCPLCLAELTAEQYELQRCCCGWNTVLPKRRPEAEGDGEPAEDPARRSPPRLPAVMREPGF